MKNEDLLNKAKLAMKNAYVPYSEFSVGAAVLCEDGNVFTGCNIENASFSATICAERVAMSKAISEGHTDFKRIAIVSSQNIMTYPCGICRQFMSEFVDKNCVIILEDEKEGIVEIKFSDLLPDVFSFEVKNGK